MKKAAAGESPQYGFYFGRLRGIRFYVDYSWFLIAAILVYMLSRNVFPFLLPGRAGAVYFVMGFTSALLFFLSVLLHELGHSIVSQRCGIPVPRIRLLFIGGIAEISREPEDPRSELKIALAGPGVSVALIFVFELLAFFFFQLGWSIPGVVFGWLGSVNLLLVIFNAIPGFPLDGGRVLRAILWARSGNLRRATYITSRIGVGFSWFLLIAGVLLLFQGHWNGLVLIIIGIFLKGAAESGYLHALYHEVLDGVQVKDVMTRDLRWIPDSLPVNLAVDEFFLSDHHRAYPVCDDSRLFRGLLRLEFLKNLPREKWPYTSAGDLAAANDSERLQIAGDEPASRALRRLLRPGHGRLAVTQHKRLLGMITRHDILRFINIHTELER